jgi:DNA-binding GntR family transcriptional regulator
VPSENELAGHFRISRMTANRALNELTAGGFLARVPGVGTFVKEPRARSSLLELRNIAEEIGARGHTHSAEFRGGRARDGECRTCRGIRQPSLPCHAESTGTHRQTKG